VIITPPERPVIIYTDCKYAIEALNDKRRTDTISARLRFRDKANGKSIKVCWVPGHAGVRGNEKAHALASGPQRVRDGLYPVLLKAPTRLFRAARKKDSKDRATRRVANITNGKVGKFTKELNSAFNSGHTRRLYDGLTAPQSAVLSQLRTGINKLNRYLHKIHCSDTPQCDCNCDCNLTETVQHFLFTCPQWVEQRRVLRIAHGETWGNLSLALGGRPWGRYRGIEEEDDGEEWRPIRENVLATINFAMATGRLALAPATMLTISTTPPTSPTLS